MSQVITKLQKGGSLTIDGIKYDATPEFINALTTHLRDTAGTDAQTLAGLSNALQNGQDLRYDSAANTISGMDGVWSGITEKQNERRRAGSSNWRKWWEAQFDTDAHRFRNALSAIGSFHYQVPKAAEETPDLANIYGDQTWYEYNTDENGNKTWLDNSSKNIGIAKRLADMTDYLSDIEAGKKKYKLGDWYSPERIDALKGLYGQYSPDTWNSAIAAIGERAKNNSLTPEDIAFLKNFNIVDPGEIASTDTDTGLSAGDKQKWQNAGYGDLIALLGRKAHLNDDGSISLNDGESWGWNLGNLEGRNIWFNDDFFNSTYGSDGTFDPFRNYTLYNNRLYALDNPTLSRILNSDGGFNTRKKAGNWTGADDLILTRFTESNLENPAYLNADAYSTFLSGNPNYRFSDLTGRYTTNGMTNGDQLIQYVDLGEDSLVGPYRQYGYKYAILDNRGNLKQDNIDAASISEIAGGSARQDGLNTYKQIVGNQGAYTGRYYEDLTDSKGDATGFRIYTSKSNPDDVILHMPEIKASGVNEQDIVIPQGLAKVLFEDKSIWDRIIGNAQNKKDFMRIISSLVRSGYRNYDSNTALDYLFGNSDKQILNRIFGTKANAVLNALKEARKGSRTQRRENYLVNQPQFKQGGIIKEQTGGVAGGSKTSTGVTERRVNAVNTNPKNSAGIVGDSKNWTDADTADLAALVADVGSLGAAFVPGANVASAVVGAAGSTSRLYADLERGTKFAIPNYLLNLGMDAATLLPIVGGVSNGAKVVRAIKKSLPTIIKAASVYGLGAGVVDTAKKIASGQKFTVRDVDMLVNALTAGVGLSRSGGLGKTSKKVPVTEGVSLKSKAGDKTISLNGKELEGVDTPDKLLDKFLSKSKLTKEQFEEQFDINSLLNEKKSWKPGWSPKNWFRKETVKTFNPKIDKKPVDINANGNKWHDWWHGVGEQQQAYNNVIMGKTKRSNYVTKTKGGQTSTKQVWDGKSWKVVKTTQKPAPDGGFAWSNVNVSPGTTNPSNVLPAPITSQLQLVPTQSMRTIQILNPEMSTITIRRGNGLKFNKKLYDLAKRQTIMIPQWINPFTMANNQENKDVQPSGFVMQPLYKKGGKIEKGQTGLKLNLDILDPNKVKSQGFIPKIDPMYKAPSGSIPTFVPNQSKELSPELQNFKVVNPMTKQAAVDTRTKQSELIQTPEDDLQGTYSAKKWDPDLNVPLNWARSLYAMKQSDKQLKNFLNRPHYQHQDLLLNDPRYINTGTGNAYRNQANQLRLFKPVTSDAMQNDLMARDRQREALQAELQGNLADSQEYGQYKTNLDAFTNDLRMKQYNIADQNAQLRWQHEIENVQAKNANIAEKSKFFDQAAYATQDWWNRNWQTKGAIDSAKAYQKELTDLDTWYNQQMTDHYSKYADSLDSDAAARNLALIKSQLELRKNKLGSTGLTSQLSPMFRKRWGYKKGGKVGTGTKSAMTYSRDPYPELLLQNAKDSTEIVKQLNDAVIKLLLQTKPINVH